MRMANAPEYKNIPYIVRPRQDGMWTWRIQPKNTVEPPCTTGSAYSEADAHRGARSAIDKVAA